MPPWMQSGLTEASCECLFAVQRGAECLESTADDSLRGQTPSLEYWHKAAYRKTGITRNLMKCFWTPGSGIQKTSTDNKSQNLVVPLTWFSSAQLKHGGV